MPYKTLEDRRAYNRSARRKLANRQREQSAERKAYARAWWRTEKGRAMAKRQALKRKARGREILDAARRVPCADCQLRFPVCCMDFHHVRGPKLFRIAQQVRHSVAGLKRELAKCIVLCANCHRIRHWPQAEQVEWPK